MAVPQYRQALPPRGGWDRQPPPQKNTHKVVAGVASCVDKFYLLIGLGAPSAVSFFLQTRFPYPPSPLPLLSALSTMHPGGAALRARFCLLYVSPGHEPFGCFEDPPVPLPRLLCCMDPQCGFKPKLPWEVFRGAFGGSKNGEVVPQGTEPVVWGPT